MADAAYSLKRPADGLAASLEVPSPRAQLPSETQSDTDNKGTVTGTRRCQYWASGRRLWFLAGQQWPRPSAGDRHWHKPASVTAVPILGLGLWFQRLIQSAAADSD